jgi:thiol-disulfide isomerase/thioredoxin
MMMLYFIRLLLILALPLTVVDALQQQPLQKYRQTKLTATTINKGRKIRKPANLRRSLLLSSAASENNNINNSDSLSSIVNGMLQTQKEIARETKELYQSLQQQKDDDRSMTMPQVGKDGIYNIINQEQLQRFESMHSDKLIVLKFSSPVCQACRMLKQQFPSLLSKNDTKSIWFDGTIVMADIVISNNKNTHDPFRDYITSELNIHKIPTIQLYKSNNELYDTISCDPQKGCSWSTIKKQILQFVDQYGPALVKQQQQQQQQQNDDNNTSVLFTEQDVKVSSSWIKRSLSFLQSIRIRIQQFIIH